MQSVWRVQAWRVTLDHFEDGFHGCMIFTSWPTNFSVGIGLGIVISSGWIKPVKEGDF